MFFFCFVRSGKSLRTSRLCHGDLWDSRESAGLGLAKTHSCSAFDPWRGQRLISFFYVFVWSRLLFYNVYFTKKNKECYNALSTYVIHFSTLLGDNFITRSTILRCRHQNWSYLEATAAASISLLQFDWTSVIVAVIGQRKATETGT